MKQAACHAVQESVASGVRLSPAGQRHLEECVSCQKVLDEYHQLEALFTFHDVVIPDGFADGVMARIGNASPCRADWFVSMQIRLATLAR